MSCQKTDWRASKTLEKKVAAVLAAMTPDEKIDFVTGKPNQNFGFYNEAIARVGIPALRMADGPSGIRVANPEIFDRRATALPAPIALAATWNLDLAHAFGDVIGDETRATGHNVFLGPAVDIARAPLGGRTFESFGEDPLLNARMASVEIEAIQSHQVIASLKHYAVNNQEFARSTVNVVIDEQTLREIYLRPFESIVRKTGIASLMGSFNKVNGIYACEHFELLHTILRKEWGFLGWVMSDYGALHSTAPSAIAGLDQEQPSAAFYGDLLKEAIESQALSIEVLDEMCTRILRTIIGLGLMSYEPKVGTLPIVAHAKIAYEVAKEAIVLLKNENAFLPLSPHNIQKIAVIGVDADHSEVGGGGSGKVRPAHSTSLLEGLKNNAPHAQLVYAQGTDPISAADLLPGFESVPSDFFQTPDKKAGGLQLQMWENTDFSGKPVYEGQMPQVALNLGFFNFPGMCAASFKYPSLPFEVTGRTSARFSGWLMVPTSGRYEFSLCLLGEANIWLDGVEIVNASYHGASRTGGEVGAAGASLGEDADFETCNERLLKNEDIVYFSCELSDRKEGHRLRIDYSTNSPTQRFLIGAQIRLGWRPPEEIPIPLIQKAVSAAAGADLAIVCVRTFESEHMDRPSLHLPNHQNTLIRAVSQVNPKTIVITHSGGPIASLSWHQGICAHLQAWFLGQEQGAALADVIFGKVNPSGKLPISFPKSEKEALFEDVRQYPGVNGELHYSEGLAVGYRGFEVSQIKPQYAFGFGLSYTTFGYRALCLQKKDKIIQINCTLANEGKYGGAETVQIYVRFPNEQMKHLIDWQKISLLPGQSKALLFEIDPEAPEHPLSRFLKGTWQRTKGEATFYVAASSEDMRLSGTLRL